jgi:phospholipase/carboxylesterase
MNRLHPWFDATSGPPAEGRLPEFEDRLADTRILRVDCLETFPTDLDETSTGRPLAVFLPEPYEPRYAYPLVVWLHGGGGSEQDLATVMPAISDQNFVGAAFRGTRAGERGFHWHADDLDDWLPELHATLCDLRRAYHVHSERIFLAGFGEGATMALRTLLRRPEWFAGALALGGDFPESPRSLQRFEDLKGKRILLGSGARDGVVPALKNAAAARLLRSAGLEVDVRTYDADRTLVPEMLREANAWLVEAAVATV